MIAGGEASPMDPYYRGFKGEIKAKTGKDSHNYQCSGDYEVIDDQTIIINELPVGKWTTDYKQVNRWTNLWIQICTCLILCTYIQLCYYESFLSSL